MIELQANLLNENQNEISSHEDNRQTHNYCTELENNDTVQVECVMNKFCLLENFEYPTYKCLTCLDKLEYICYLCIDHCHKNHNILGQKGSIVTASKTVFMKNQKCQCALNDHMKKTSSSKKDLPKSSLKVNNLLNHDMQTTCPLNEVISLLGPKGHIVDATNSENYCLYCITYCQEKNIEATFISSKGDLPQCSCKNVENHSTLNENLNNLNSIINDNQIDKYINKFKLPFQLFNNNNFLLKYFEIYLKKNYDLNLLWDDKESLFDFGDIKSFDYCLDFLNNLCKCYSSKLTFYQLFHNNNDASTSSNLYQTFSLEFLSKLFSIPEKIPDPFLKLKLCSLKFFRKFVFSPEIIKSKNLSSFDCFENMTPFHRFILSNRMPIELNNIFEEPPEKNKTTFIINKYQILLDKIRTSLIAYSNNSINEIDYISLGVEYLKLINLIMPYLYLQPNKYIKAFENIKQVISLLKCKKLNNNLVINILEKIVYKLLIMNNDYAILFSLKRDEKSTEDVKFAFQDNDFNKALLTTLFAFSKEANDSSSYLKNKDFYDMLINDNDYYIDNLKNLNNSDFKMLTEEIMNLLHSNSVNNSNKSLNSLEYERSKGEEIYETEEFLKEFVKSEQIVDISKTLTEIKNLLNTSSIIFMEMIQCKINEEIYLIRLEENLQNLSSLLTSKYLIMNDDKKILFKKQMLFLKIGGFNSLINIIKVFKKVDYLYLNDELFYKQTKCSNEILQILNMTCSENPFLCALFFNRSIIQLFLEGNKEKLFSYQEFKFYYEKLQILEKYNYKINSEFFLMTIISQFDFTYWKEKSKTDEGSEKLKTILKMCVSLLNITSEKSIKNINEKIFNVIFKILKTEEFEILLNNLHTFLVENSRKNLLKRKRNKSNIENELDSEQTTNKNESSSPLIKLNNSDTHLVRLVYTCVNLLNSEYFYLLNGYLHMKEISDILSLVHSVEPELRRIFTKSYCRYLIESYFKIFPNVSSEILKEFTNEIDINLELKIDEMDADNINKLDKINENSIYENMNVDKAPKIDVNSQIFEIKESLEIIGEEGNLRIPTKQSHKNICHKEALKPIIKNFEKYRIIYHYFEEEFKGNLELKLKYFEDVILLPSLFAIYKIIYFSKSVTAHSKYNIYKFIFLFLNCYKFFIETLRQFNLDDSKIAQTVGNFINVPETFFDEKNGSIIKQFSLKTLHDLDKDIKIMNGEAYEQLNLKSILDFYFKYVKHFSSTKKILFKDEDVKTDVENQDSNNFSNKVSKVINVYKSAKTNFEEDNVLHIIFTTDNEKDPEIESIKNTIILDLLFKIEPISYDDSPNLFKAQNMDVFESINKLFKSDPITWQNSIVNSASIFKANLDSIIKYQIPFSFQFIFVEFNRLDTKNNSMHYANFINTLEFLRLLCEDHNKFFQTFLINSLLNDREELTLLNFIFKLPIICLNNINYYKNKKEILSYFKSTKTQFFDVLINKITDFIVEIIQGAFSFNFSDISQSKEFESYYDHHNKFLDLVNDEEDYEIFMANFIRLINCFIEENSNKLENKTSLIKKLNPKKLMVVLVNSFKKLYIKNCCSSEVKPAIIENKSNKSISNLNKEKESILQNSSQIFTVGFNKKLINTYINDGENFSADSLFMITIGIFIYFKRVSLYKSGGLGEKIKNLLINLENNSEFYEAQKHLDENTSNKNKQPWVGIIKNELYLFLNKIVKNVEISYKIKESVEDAVLRKYKTFFENDEKSLDTLNKLSENNSEESMGIDNVIFLVNPLSLFLRPSDYYTFIEKAPYDNFNKKLTFILEYFSEFSNTLQIRRQLSNFNSSVLSFLFKLNYNYMEILSACFSLLTCVLMLLSMEYQYTTIKPETITPNDNPEASKIEEKVRVDFANPYKKNIRIISVTHLSLLGIIIFNWIIFTLFKHSKSSINTSQVFYKRIALYFGLLINAEVFPFLWNFIFGFTALLRENFTFVYALQLFTIFNISPTMSSVLYAVRIRYKQFLSTGFLLIILMLFYASITFYFFKDELFNADLNENICDTFLQCFLYLINYGIRSGEGVPFSIKSFNKDGYWSQFIYAWVFYFIIILIVLNIINGIIVDTFQALREQNNQRDNVRENVCFICSLNRGKFETKGISFENHRLKEHNILNYFEFLMKINFTDEFELNSLETDVLNSFKEQRTDFFPVKKAKCLESFE